MPPLAQIANADVSIFYSGTGMTYLNNSIVVLCILTEHDRALAISTKGGNKIGLQNCPKLEREVEDCCLH